MKKILSMVLVGLGVTACSSSYDYYTGDVKYVQDGEDCIYYAEESGRKFTETVRMVDSSERVVYRNTSCRSLYKKDSGEIVPAAKKSEYVYQPVRSMPVAVMAPEYVGSYSVGSVPVSRRYYVVSR